jgi:hypothetical protein
MGFEIRPARPDDLPLPLFDSAGFRRLATFDDPYLVAEPSAVPAHVTVPNPTRFHLVVLRED